jgi:molybdate transport system substrate-binding protein
MCPGASTWVTAALVALMALAAGCRADGRARLSVHAASSLADALTEFEEVYERAHPEVDVVLSFAGSQVLRLQIEEGADAALYVSANRGHMRALEASGDVVFSEVFAHNTLALVVPSDNPAGVERFEARVKARRLALGTAQVPVGIYARQLLRAADQRYGADFGARVLGAVASQESGVRLIRARVELGQADAGLVYETDASSPHLIKVPIPAALNVQTPCLLGLTRRARSDERQERRAMAFIDALLSDQGQSLLSRHGFERVR